MKSSWATLLALASILIWSTLALIICGAAVGSGGNARVQMEEPV